MPRFRRILGSDVEDIQLSSGKGFGANKLGDEFDVTDPQDLESLKDDPRFEEVGSSKKGRRRLTPEEGGSE